MENKHIWDVITSIHESDINLIKLPIKILDKNSFWCEFKSKEGKVIFKINNKYDIESWIQNGSTLYDLLPHSKFYKVDNSSYT